MARSIEIENLSSLDDLSVEELRYLLDRPWQLREIRLQRPDLQVPRVAEFAKYVEDREARGSDDEGDEEEADDDYEDMNVPELRTALRERDLDTSGNKAELIARLRKSDEDQAD